MSLSDGGRVRKTTTWLVEQTVLLAVLTLGTAFSRLPIRTHERTTPVVSKPTISHGHHPRHAA